MQTTGKSSSSVIGSSVHRSPVHDRRARARSGWHIHRAVKIGFWLAIVLGALLVVGLGVSSRFLGENTSGGQRAAAVVPVETVEIERGDIRDIRTLSGTLIARSRAMVATRIAGRVEELHFNIGDVVESNEIIAILDGEEYQQAVNEAEAELRLAEATLAETESMLEIAARNFHRVDRLFGENIASESERDIAKSEFEATEARVRVSHSQVARAEAQLRAAEVRFSYATIRAIWPGGNGPRIIGERFVDEGSTVGLNDPIVSLLDIDTLVAVVYVSERDYAKLRLWQPCRVMSESHGGEAFTGEIVRMAPEFREASRQARVEVEINNPDHILKPGMFVRVQVELARSEDAIVVPREAIISRRGVEGVFLLDDEGMTVRFVPVAIGIRAGEVVELLDPVQELFSGRVVTLGQHLLDDGSRIRNTGEHR